MTADNRGKWWEGIREGKKTKIGGVQEREDKEAKNSQKLHHNHLPNTFPPPSSPPFSLSPSSTFTPPTPPSFVRITSLPLSKYSLQSSRPPIHSPVCHPLTLPTNRSSLRLLRVRLTLNSVASPGVPPS